MAVVAEPVAVVAEPVAVVAEPVAVVAEPVAVVAEPVAVVAEPVAVVAEPVAVVAELVAVVAAVDPQPADDPLLAAIIAGHGAAPVNLDLDPFGDFCVNAALSLTSCARSRRRLRRSPSGTAPTWRA